MDLQVHRPADGIFIRLPCRTVQRCQGLLGEFVKGRPIRKVCDGLNLGALNWLVRHCFRCAHRDLEALRAMPGKFAVRKSSC